MKNYESFEICDRLKLNNGELPTGIVGNHHKASLRRALMASAQPVGMLSRIKEPFRLAADVAEAVFRRPVFKPALAIIIVAALVLMLAPALNSPAAKVSASDIALRDPQVLATFTPGDLAKLNIQETDEGNGQTLVTLSSDSAVLVLGVDIAAKKVSQWLFDSTAQSQALPVAQPGILPNTKYQLIFDSGMNGPGSLYIVNTDGSNLTKLTDNSAIYRDPDWSPTGQKLILDLTPPNAFTTYGIPSPRELYAMNADGSGLIQLTKLGDAYLAKWSPDGMKIVFAGQPLITLDMMKAAAAKGIAPDSDYEIYVMNADGSNLKQLTDNYVGAKDPITPNGLDINPQWSPDGQKIAFKSNIDGNWEIYVVNADGTNLQNLTKNPASDGRSFSWSPDGKKIVFTSERSGILAVYTMNIDGSGVTKLTQDNAKESYPTWSPDGTKIAFESMRDGNGEIYLVNPDGTGLTRLTNSQAEDFSPLWSPDGGQIAFDSYDGVKSYLNIMNADGSGQLNLAESISEGATWAALSSYPLPPVAQNDVIPQPVPARLWPVTSDQALSIAKTYVPASVISQAKISVSVSPTDPFKGTNVQNYYVEFWGVSVTKVGLGWENQVKATASGNSLVLTAPVISLLGSEPYQNLRITINGIDGKVISLVATGQSQVPPSK